jgi:uncharacterized protein YdgA (DUF945 family)
MKKSGAIVVVIVVLAVFGLPPVLGMLTENDVEARVAAIADNPFVTASVSSVDRGWFSSRAEIELALSPTYVARLEALSATSGEPIPAAQRLARGATIVVDFTHGPIATGDGVYFGLSKMTARLDPETEGYTAWLEQLGIPYLFEFRGRTSYAGRLTFDADVQPIDVDTADGGVRFSGAVLNGVLSGGTLRYDMGVQSLEIASEASTLALQAVHASGDHDLRRRYLMLGRVDATIDSFTASDTAVSAAPTAEARNVRFTSNLTLDDTGTLVNGEVTYGADSFIAPPEVMLADASLRVVLRNLDADALEAYAEAAQQNAAASLDDPRQLLAALAPSVERLLAAEPSVAIDPLRFELNGEPFEARLALAARNDALPPAGALDLRDPTLWLAVVDATANASLSKQLGLAIATQAAATQIAATGAPPDQVESMAEAQAGLMLVTLVAQGMLVDDGQRYSVEIAFTDGALTVNGSPLPFGATP